jgi:phosphatidylinositol glycan class V
MFRYWTLSNIPLFLLAAPMLLIMIISGIWGSGIKDTVGTQSMVSERVSVRKLALSQLVLAVMAIVSYHVQIITRLSSGYMVWYWWVSCQISVRGRVEERTKGKNWTEWVVRYMILYGVIQGVLFAGFLPPA